jgi:hypothetical protein
VLVGSGVLKYLPQPSIDFEKSLYELWWSGADCGSNWSLPDIEGLDTFKGKVLHTAKWYAYPTIIYPRSNGPPNTGTLPSLP